MPDSAALRMFPRSVLTACLLCAWPAAVGAQTSGPIASGGGPLATEARCLSPQQQARFDLDLLRALRRSPSLSELSAPPEKFSFFPMAGSLYRDLYHTNFVDLGASTAVLSFDCLDQSYDGHRGHDVILRTFTEQEIGVPVFAALDGRVILTHDGEDDHHTTWTGDPNFVRIDHGNRRICDYLHLRQFSVAVNQGDLVKAGQEIGMTASSGWSTYPHLHFETRDGVPATEPHAGPCRPGASQWLDQPPVERSFYAQDFNLTDVDIGLQPGLPYDIPRQGTWLPGWQRVSFWTMVHNQPAGMTTRVVFRRPDGSTFYDSGTSAPSGSPFYYTAWWWWAYVFYFDQLGTWELALTLNDVEIARVPFDIVATPAEQVNRPPYAVAAALEPEAPSQHDVLICRTNADLVHDDPDFDVVRYHYQWYVNGVLARDLVSAGHSDAFPRGTAPDGALVECVVTPGDGSAEAAPALDAVVVEWIDTTAPVIQCPAPIVRLDGFADGRGETVVFSVSATDDLDPAPVVVANPPSGSRFPPGETVVDCTATDAAGNQASCSFTVTIQPKARRR